MIETNQVANAKLQEEEEATTIAVKREGGAAPTDIKITADVQEYVDGLRRGMRCERHRTALEDATQVDCLLSCASLEDRDMPELIQALSLKAGMTKLDLSYNGFSDVGLQPLLLLLSNPKALPNLNKLIVKHCNNLTEITARMCVGLKMMRKSLDVKLDD